MSTRLHHLSHVGRNARFERQVIMSGAQKYYKLHWLTGQVEIIHGGNSISEAFAIAGYGGGAIRALDWYEECAENAMEQNGHIAQQTNGDGSLNG